MKKISPFSNILIIGLGVMGGSYLKRLAPSNANLYAIEIDENTKSKVLNDKINVEFITMDNKEILNEIDLVVVTLYPKLVIPLFDELNNVLNKDCLVCEISGIKRDNALLLQAKEYDFQYILVHPMAGRESGGYDYSDQGIFDCANHIIIDCPINTSSINKEKYINFIKMMGFNKPIFMNENQHDAAITYTSQLSHILAVTLLNSADYNENTKLSIGDSFRDLTRIAKMNINLWSTLFVDNNELLTNSIDNLIDELNTMKQLIKNNDQELIDYLNKAKKRRIDIEKREL